MAGKFSLSDHIQPAKRDIGAITANILAVKREAGSKLLELGRCLLEAKAVLPHGEWLPWLENQVGFSERAAQQYMKLAREYTNPQALADLGATKALMLLALPEGERAEFIEVPHQVGDGEKSVREMSTRELEKALREREEALAEKSAAEQARQKMEQDMSMSKRLLETAWAERDAARQEVSQLAEQLDELKSRPVEVAVKVDREAVEQVRRETEASMRGKLDKADAAQKQAEERRKAAEEALSAARAELEKAKAEGQAARTLAEMDGKRAAVAAAEDLALFQVLLGQVQDEVNRMSGVLMKVQARGDAGTAERLRRAILTLADRVKGCADGVC